MYKIRLLSRLRQIIVQYFISFVGSKCYEFYTYSQNCHSDDAWDKKLSGIFHSNFVSDDMIRGTELEPVALKIFADGQSGTLYRAGFIVNQYLPIFGYSPDGLLLQDGSLRLVEVKCPKPRESEEEVIINCQRFLQRGKNGEVVLRQKCPYYGQVQLGMFITDTRKCHFLVHLKHEKRNIEIIIDYNSEFVHNMLRNLVDVYFKYYLTYVKKYYR